MQEQVLIYDRIASNRRRTFVLMAVFFVVVAAAATAVGIVAGLPPGLAPIVIVFVAGFVSPARIRSARRMNATSIVSSRTSVSAPAFRCRRSTSSRTAR